jgi:hypothetical protein
MPSGSLALDGRTPRLWHSRKEKAMQINRYITGQASERQRELTEQAQRQRLGVQLRSVARATRHARRTAPGRQADWRIALSPSTRLR